MWGSNWNRGMRFGSCPFPPFVKLKVSAFLGLGSNLSCDSEIGNFTFGFFKASAREQPNTAESVSTNNILDKK